MEFITIFDKVLYSFKDANTDEGEQIFDSEWDKTYAKWMDHTYVYEFMEENEKYLSSPYFKKFPITKQEARQQIYDEALNIKLILKEACLNARSGMPLDHFFKPLNNNESSFKSLATTKGKSLIKIKSKTRLLRVYAIRIDANVFVLTGGAIKLVEFLKEHNETYTEQLKMDRVRSFLNENGIADEDGFFELICE
jgi:hypothetical protein